MYWVMHEQKKLRIDEPFSWESHRGGWKHVVNMLRSKAHNPNGILFISSIEDEIMIGKSINEPWVGFVHQVPKHHYKRYLDLERLLRNPDWLRSRPFCRGIFTLSHYIKDYLDAQQLNITVNYVPYAIDWQFKEFDLRNFINARKKVVFIGEYLRNFQAFYDLRAGDYQKILLANKSSKNAEIVVNDSVKLLDRLTDQEYDQLLSESLVFLNLFDAPANTTVVECLGRNTPILINKLPGVVEYLGSEYPFYYDDIQEAAYKLSDYSLIEKTWRYLASSDKKPMLKMEYFMDQLFKSSIYQNL